LGANRNGLGRQRVYFRLPPLAQHLSPEAQRRSAHYFTAGAYIGQLHYLIINDNFIAYFQLCAYAQAWANHLAHTTTFYYRNDRQIGQNLFCRPVGPQSQAEISGIILLFAKTKNQFNCEIFKGTKNIFGLFKICGIIIKKKWVSGKDVALHWYGDMKHYDFLQELNKVQTANVHAGWYILLYSKYVS